MGSKWKSLFLNCNLDVFFSYKILLFCFALKTLVTSFLRHQQFHPSYTTVPVDLCLMVSHATSYYKRRTRGLMPGPLVLRLGEIWPPSTMAQTMQPCSMKGACRSINPSGSVFDKIMYIIVISSFSSKYYQSLIETNVKVVQSKETNITITNILFKFKEIV